MQREMPQATGVTPPLTIGRQGHVATVTFSHPPNNHIDRALVILHTEAMAALDADDSVCAVVLAGAGRYFCAGARFFWERFRWPRYPKGCAG